MRPEKGCDSWRSDQILMKILITQEYSFKGYQIDHSLFLRQLGKDVFKMCPIQSIDIIYSILSIRIEFYHADIVLDKTKDRGLKGKQKPNKKN